MRMQPKLRELACREISFNDLESFTGGIGRGNCRVLRHRYGAPWICRSIRHRFPTQSGDTVGLLRSEFQMEMCIH